MVGGLEWARGPWGDKILPWGLSIDVEFRVLFSVVSPKVRHSELSLLTLLDYVAIYFRRSNRVRTITRKSMLEF